MERGAPYRRHGCSGRDKTSAVADAGASVVLVRALRRPRNGALDESLDRRDGGRCAESLQRARHRATAGSGARREGALAPGRGWLPRRRGRKQREREGPGRHAVPRALCRSGAARSRDLRARVAPDRRGPTTVVPRPRTVRRFSARYRTRGDLPDPRRRPATLAEATDALQSRRAADLLA